jgi:hypothetical protein
MGTKLGSTCGTLGSAETAPGTHVLDPDQNTIKRCINKKYNEWQLASMNEWLGIDKRKKMAEMKCQLSLSI